MYTMLSRDTVVYTTLTSLCPVTETKVVEGSTRIIVWTSTSTIHTRVAQTATVYTTSVATAYKSTEVYQTVCSNSPLVYPPNRTALTGR